MGGHAAVIVGAGFSKPHGGPLLAEVLSDGLVKVSAGDAAALKILARLAAEGTDDGRTFDGLEGLFTTLLQEATTGGSFAIDGQSFAAAPLLNQLRLHLSSMCNHFRVDGRRKETRMYAEFFAARFEEAKSLTVVSFNYDLIVEDTLDRAGIPFGYGNLPAFGYGRPSREEHLRKADDRIDILKVHGSSNWGICRGCRTGNERPDWVTIFDDPYVPRSRRTKCPRCEKAMLAPGIVPPVNQKTGEIKPLREVWKKARVRLARATDVMIVGYSLPRTDREAISLFREIPGPPKRRRVSIVCGRSGAPDSYKSMPWKFTDFRLRFEDYLETWP